MKQIFYTQCPIGYGLGASNGFQIKRLSAGYPVTSDFRHLGLRAFVPGTRQMAPAALRYRRGEGGEAEVAFLTPRSHEYETERGLWGRPGGHFAHGLQLDAAELQAIQSWPAGLYNAPFWVRSDPGPSREESPPEIAFPPDRLGITPAFDHFARLAGDKARLARLLTALATVVQEGRTLFLIDAPEHLAEHVALLTFAFPEPYRQGLTFSTYHDRPEELPGLRLQGTTAAARPNRAVLLSLGVVADLERGTIDPEVLPASWACRLAGWLARGDAAGRCAFEATHRRGQIAAGRDPGAVREADWLANLIALDDVLTQTQPPPDWPRFAQLAAWCGRMGLGKDWAQARGPDWWRERIEADPSGLAALVAHLQLPPAWRSRGSATAWGRALARGCEGQPVELRRSAIRAVLSVAPAEERPGFIRALVRDLPQTVGAQVLHDLRAMPECGPALLLPLEVGRAASALRECASGKELLRCLSDAVEAPAALSAVLDALAEAADDGPDLRHALARTLGEAFDAAEGRGRSLILAWCLGRDDASAWVGPMLRRAFADPLNVDGWRAVLARTPPALRAAFATVALGVAGDPALPDEAFRWGIEEALLALPENERPGNPSWPREFLARTRSDLDLIRWLYVKRFLKPGIKAWLNDARQRGALAPEQEARLDGCKEYARALRAGDARALLDVRLPIVPAEERGAVLGQILSSVDTVATDGLDLALDAVREAWPGGFQAGAPGLAGLGHVLAEAIGSLWHDPPYWLDRLALIIRRLGLDRNGGGFEPDSLAAEVLAATCHSDVEGFSPWRLRHHVLQTGHAWKAIAIDVRRDLERHPEPRSLEALDGWDRALEKGLHTARFFEVWLNVCGPRALGLAVASRASALKSLDLSWWDHARHSGARDDVRDAFARLAPIVPIAGAALLDVEKWLSPARHQAGSPSPSRVYDEGGLAPLEQASASRPRAEHAVTRLSTLGNDRWACWRALCEFDGKGIEALGRWGRLLQPGLAERLGRLEPRDGYRFLAWLIHLSDEFDEVPVPRLAAWLCRAEVADLDRFGSWPDELKGLADVPSEARLRKAHLVAELRDEVKRVLNDERERRRISRVADSP